MDHSGYAAFAAAVRPTLCRAAMLHCRDAHLAEDLVQTTLTRLYEHWDRVRTADSPEAYARTTLAHTWASHARKRSNAETPHLYDAAHDARPAVHPDPDDRLMLLSALAELDELDRAVIVLRYWEECSVEHTARATGLTDAAVKSRSFRTLRRLRTQLEAC